MSTEPDGTETPFDQTLSPTDQLGDACPVPGCQGRLDLVFG